jgi:hypothetical protein
MKKELNPRKYKTLPADPADPEAQKIAVPANGHTFTIDELEKLAGHPLLSPVFKADQELREAVEATLSNAIIIDELKAQNKRSFHVIARRAIALTPEAKQGEAARSLLASGVELGYITEREIAAVLHAYVNEQQAKSQSNGG